MERKLPNFKVFHALSNFILPFFESPILSQIKSSIYVENEPQISPIFQYSCSPPSPSIPKTNYKYEAFIYVCKLLFYLIKAILKLKFKFVRIYTYFSSSLWNPIYARLVGWLGSALKNWHILLENILILCNKHYDYNVS